MIKRLLLSIFLLLGGLTGLQAQSALDASCNLTVADEWLDDCLLQLMRQCDAPLSFQTAIIPPRKINVQFSDAPLREILNKLLENTDLSFQDIEGQVVLFKKPPSNYTISGFITEGTSGEPLQGATIYDWEQNKGAVANAYGFYSLTLPSGETTLSVSYVGHQNQTFKLDLQSNQVLNIEMLSNLDLPQVVVTPKLEKLEKSEQEISAFAIQPDAIEQLPSLGGEPDLLRVTHLLPGVETGADGAGGIFVRGGSADQNLVLIDGVPVYNVFHAAGMFSVFNTNAIRSAKLLKGGFPARYGGRLSSVLDIRMKEGNMKAFKGQADIGLMTGRLTLEGPIVKDKASFFISARRSFLDFYLPALSAKWKEKNNNEDGETDYLFYDLNAKINYRISQKDQIFLSLYTGRDLFMDQAEASFALNGINSQGDPVEFRTTQRYEDQLEWGNTVSAFRWNHVVNKKLFSNFTLTYSKLGVGIDYFTQDLLDRIVADEATNITNLANIGRFNSSIEDVGGKVDFDFVPSSKHYIRLGLGITGRSFVPGALYFNGLSSDTTAFTGQLSNEQIRSTEYYIYAEDEVQFSDRFLMNIGLRASNLSLDDINYGYLQPRLSLNWLVSKRLVYRAAFSRMVQYLHLLSQSGFGLPSDLWVSSTKDVAPQTSWQVVTGIDYELKDFGELTAEVYYKNMDQLINYTEGANFLNNWEENITVGEGTTYGFELMIKKTSGKTTGWLSYNYAFANRTFEKINLGRTYPFRYDRRHSAKLVLSHWLSPKIQLTANWIFSTGSAFSAALEKFYIVDPETGRVDELLDFQEKNKFRLRNYHRLDIGANFLLSDQDKAVSHTLKLGIYNLYNRRNPLYYKLRSYVELENNSLQINRRYVEVPMLPFLPSVNYTIKF